MQQLMWTLVPPTEPGWYWAMNDHEIPGSTWQAIVRVERLAGSLFAMWHNEPGSAKMLHESEWDDRCLWAGPLHPPELCNN